MSFSFLHFLIYQTYTFINYQLCIFSPSINFLIIFMTSSFLKIKRTTRYPIPESTTLTNSSTVLWSFHKLTILQMQITATILIPTVIKFLLNILILQICRLSCLSGAWHLEIWFYFGNFNGVFSQVSFPTSHSDIPHLAFSDYVS